MTDHETGAYITTIFCARWCDRLSRPHDITSCGVQPRSIDGVFFLNLSTPHFMLSPQAKNTSISTDCCPRLGLCCFRETIAIDFCPPLHPHASS